MAQQCRPALYCKSIWCADDCSVQWQYFFHFFIKEDFRWRCCLNITTLLKLTEWCSPIHLLWKLIFQYLWVTSCDQCKNMLNTHRTLSWIRVYKTECVFATYLPNTWLTPAWLHIIIYCGNLAPNEMSNKFWLQPVVQDIVAGFLIKDVLF